MDKKRSGVYDKSDGKCWYCGELLKKGWHIDHFLPLKRNPDNTVENPQNDTLDNLVPSCPSCNILKSSMDIESFRWLIGNFITSLNRDVSIYRHAKKYGLIKETQAEVRFWFENQ